MILTAAVAVASSMYCSSHKPTLLVLFCKKLQILVQWSQYSCLLLAAEASSAAGTSMPQQLERNVTAVEWPLSLLLLTLLHKGRMTCGVYHNYILRKILLVAFRCNGTP